MRSTPRCRVRHEIKNGAASIVMADQGASLTAVTGPVATSRIHRVSGRHTVELLACKYIVSVRRVASASDGTAVFGDRR